MMMSPTLLAFLILGQGAGFTDSMGYFARTTYYTADGATFSIHGYYPDVDDLPSGISESAGGVSGAQARECEIGLGAGRAFTQTGTASYSMTVQFYFCGKYSGDLSMAPHPMSATSPKDEFCSATASLGDTATGSTSNNSASAANSTSNPPDFINAPAVSATWSDWALQSDGTYAFWNYAYTNNMSVSASHPNPTDGQAGAGAKVTFNLANLLAQ